MTKVAGNASLYAEKTVVVMGLTRHTLALAKWLHGAGAKVRISELRPKDHLLELEKELAALKPAVESEFGKNTSPLFEGADTVIISAGISLDTKPLDEVRARGTPIVSETEFLLKQVEKPVVAVLGSEGKTSTCLHLAHILKTQGKKVFYCGDLGRPLAEYFSDETEYDFVLTELSMAQAESLQNFQPRALAFLNLHPPFPERFAKMDDCVRALSNVLRFVRADTTIVYHHKDNTLRTILVPVQATKFVFRRKDPLQVSPELALRYRGVYLGNAREMVWLENGQKESFNLSQVQLFGLHSRDNLMAAVSMAKALGVPSAVIQKAIDTVPAIPHRLELIKKKGGVRFINDSRATTVEGLRKAIESFSLDPIILIAGGKDTQADFSPLADLVKKRVKTMILIGEAKEHINRCVGDHTETFLVGTFEEAVLLSYQKSREGDIILLSPGCEGYDMFTGYEERGNYFKKYVAEI